MDEYKISTAESVMPSGKIGESHTAFSGAQLEVKSVEKSRSLKSFALLLVAAFSFLVPIAFMGTTSAYTVKMGLILISTALLLGIAILSTFSEKKISLPKTKFILPLLLIPLSLTVSSIFSGSFLNSFFGNTGEVGTAVSFVALAALLLGSLFAFSHFKPHALLTKAYLLTSVLLLIHFFLVTSMYQGWIKPINNFPVLLSGSYIDLAILLALTAAVCVFILNSGERSLKTKISLWLLAGVSLIVVGAVGSMAVELCLAAILAIEYFATKKISKFAAVVFLASLIFAIAGSRISAPLSSALKVNSLDVKPSVSATTNIVLTQWKHNVLTGAGPNRFADLWAQYKPSSINLSDFWAQDFFFGSSIGMTLAATGGLLFVLLALLFAVFFIRGGLKALYAPASEGKYLAVASFLVSFILWVFFFIYNPGIVVLALTFISTALFAQSLALLGAVPYSNVLLSGKVKMAGVLLATLVLVGSLGYSGIYTWKRIHAADVFAQTLSAYQQGGELAKAEIGILRAIAISESDLYDRTLSNVYNMDLSAKISNLKAEATEQQKAELQGEVNAAISWAKRATLYNPKNYLNSLAEAKVYEQLAYQNVEGALASAEASYAEAEKMNPGNPATELALARLSVLKGDMEKAREYSNKSIALKPNYSAAYYLLAQLEAAVNNVPQAIANVEKAAASDPNNAGLHFQLGLIKYNVKDFKGAATAFENSVKIIPEYANAKYFLGLSYYYSGNKEGALKQFQDVEKSNPDNAEIKLVLENLTAGRDPFTNAKPPIDNKPGKRKTPPIE
jgi:Flp pilus assembly protein TadD